MQYQSFMNLSAITQSYSILARWQELYDRAKTYPIIERKIPKIIHQIWLGGQLPEKFKNWCDSWQKFHPEWIYKLWTDADANLYPFKNKDLFDRATNLGEKADIWRYELLETFGGLYTDIDEECLQSFDDLHNQFDFYVGLQSLDTGYVQLGIAVIGSIAHHPLLVKAIAELSDRTHEQQIVIRTGPIFFTMICLKYAGIFGLRDVILPASYFYPCGYTQTGQLIETWLKRESYAVHHWAGSWLK